MPSELSSKSHGFNFHHESWPDTTDQTKPVKGKDKAMV